MTLERAIEQLTESGLGLERLPRSQCYRISAYQGKDLWYKVITEQELVLLARRKEDQPEVAELLTWEEVEEFLFQVQEPHLSELQEKVNLVNAVERRVTRYEKEVADLEQKVQKLYEEQHKLMKDAKIALVPHLSDAKFAQIQIRYLERGLE